MAFRDRRRRVRSLLCDVIYIQVVLETFKVCGHSLAAAFKSTNLFRLSNIRWQMLKCIGWCDLLLTI